MSAPDIAADAARAFSVLRSGGSAILPMDVGYSIIGGSTGALIRIFDTKGRAPEKLNAMIGDNILSEELHHLDAAQRAVVDALTRDRGLPLGIIAQADMDHPLIRALDDEGRRRSTRDGTICMLLNAGAFHAAISRLSHEACHPLFGSSANRTLQGTKFRVEDIEPEIRAVADVEIDYGLRKYHLYGKSSTLLDLRDMSVVREGSCYELIRDALDRDFGIAIPEPRQALVAA
ncbi:Sua5/YciO/YrdC/YwlC family protein [Salipiger sp.]|uniref:Sua5/YciO/YrdC/YwlC family protein n=1 Tax=Salipiger sp. TaxID=2078585 RepID=UPI003A9788E2